MHLNLEECWYGRSHYLTKFGWKINQGAIFIQNTILKTSTGLILTCTIVNSQLSLFIDIFTFFPTDTNEWLHSRICDDTKTKRQHDGNPGRIQPRGSL